MRITFFLNLLLRNRFTIHAMCSARVLRIFSRGAPGRPFHGASGVYSYYYLAPWTHGPTFLWVRGSVNMPPKKDNRAPAALAWVFTHQADCQDLQDTDTLLAEGEELVGRIIDCCQIYAFQLEVAPTTGQLHWKDIWSCSTKNG